MVLNIVGGVAIVAAAVAATILLNLTLLGSVQPRNDPVGKLSPRAMLVAPPGARPPSPHVVVRAHSEGESDD